MKTKLLILFCIGIFMSECISAQNETRVFVNKAGTLISNFTEEEANQIVHLTITGKINAIDFKHLREGFGKLEILDISNAQIRTYAGKDGTYPDKFNVYQPNCVPGYAFCKVIGDQVIGKASLKKVILSDKTKTIEECAFKACENLKICLVNKKTAPSLKSEALADSITAIFVPLGSRDNYRFEDNWGSFSLLEGEPVTVNITIEPSESLNNKILETGAQPKEINYLTISGKLDDADFKLIRDYMPNLVSIDIENTTAVGIPNFTFTQKRYLINVILPKELKTIGERAFSNCERLSGSLILPPTLTSIDFGAFMGCINLKRVIATGNNLTTLGERIFGDESSKLIYHR